MRRKLTPYILLVPQALLTILFLIGLVNGITQSLGVIPAFGLTEPTLLYYKEVLPDTLFLLSAVTTSFQILPHQRSSF